MSQAGDDGSGTQADLLSYLKIKGVPLLTQQGDTAGLLTATSVREGVWVLPSLTLDLWEARGCALLKCACESQTRPLRF